MAVSPPHPKWLVLFGLSLEVLADFFPADLLPVDTYLVLDALLIFLGDALLSNI